MIWYQLSNQLLFSVLAPNQTCKARDHSKFIFILPISPLMDLVTSEYTKVVGLEDNLWYCCSFTMLLLHNIGNIRHNWEVIRHRIHLGLIVLCLRCEDIWEIVPGLALTGGLVVIWLITGPSKNYYGNGFRNKECTFKWPIMILILSETRPG